MSSNHLPWQLCECRACLTKQEGNLACEKGRIPGDPASQQMHCLGGHSVRDWF